MDTLTPAEIARLSPQERLILIGDLWDSLDEAEIPLTPAQAAELEHRLAGADRDRVDSVSWEELKIELQDRLK